MIVNDQTTDSEIRDLEHHCEANKDDLDAFERLYKLKVRSGSVSNRDRDKEKDRRRAVAIRRVVTEVAPVLLGDEWGVEPARDSDRGVWNDRVSYKRRDGARVYFSTDWAAKPDEDARVTVGGSFPEGFSQRYGGAVKAPDSVTVSTGRPAKALIADIRRRFLDAYLGAFGQAVQAKGEHEGRVATSGEIAAELAKIIGGRSHYQEGAARYEAGNWQNEGPCARDVKVDLDGDIEIGLYERSDTVPATPHERTGHEQGQ